ncbi:MAG: tRNA pseudouridine(13) synthase TruD [Candidatus Poribacteria bacterium]|nr:tRNA pseudouridine(13) synthase TruD [Candidatus Poribacteria bacterium]
MIGGKMIFEPEDFIVEELPLYQPSGDGTHTYFAIRKRNLTTLEAINRIARELRVKARNIGYTGLKDKRAITTQVLSVEGVTPQMVLQIELPRIEVLWAERHDHKLRVGHLRGNRFEITLRGVSSNVLHAVRDEMTRLETEGVPNRFGEQRFGNKQDSHLIGKALLKNEWKKAVGYVLSDDTAQNGYLKKRVKRELEQGLDEKAVACIPHRLRKLYLSAYQAFLFNCIVDKRIPNLGKLYDGDIAIKHSNGAPFLVENAKIEQPRADAFEISPSGPIFGYKMRQPTGMVEDMEFELLATEGVERIAFRRVAGIRLPGTRRPLRMKMELDQVISVEEGLRLCFTLPAGGYATVVLDVLKPYTISNK